MSYNGSGTFQINTAGQPVVSGTVISSTAFNALTADLATGLSTAITKDGQTTPTANIPMGNNKITGLAVGTAATDAANLSQVQSTAAKLINSVSGADTVTGVLSPTLGAYAAGQMFYWVAAGDNTGAVTLNIDSLGAKSVTRDGSVALAAGDIKSGEVVVVVYDGTRFQVVSQLNSAGDARFANVSIASTLYVGGVATFTSGTAAAPAITTAGDTNTGIFFPAADTIAFAEGGTEAMRIDSSGNLGIGTTSPTAGYRITASDSIGGIRIESSSTTAGNQPRIEFFHTGNDSFQIRAGSGLSFWQSSTTEVMRIAFGGEVYIAGFADQGAYNLQVAGTGVWGAGAYVNGSDARLKDNIQSLDSGLDVVKAMRAVTFQYKPEHSKDQSVQPGFIAQELQQAMAGKPYLDGVVQAGPEYLNVAYQNIIPILVKAIQELEAKVAALEAK